MSTQLDGNGAGQRLLFELPNNQSANRIASAAASKRRHAVDRSDKFATALQLLLKTTQDLAERVVAVEARLAELRDAVVATPAMPKEFYSTLEAAKLLGKRPYTVREWCRLGRVRAEKTHAGRGLDEEWRIPHAELTRIQNEGLLPLVKYADVPPPRRLPK